MTDDSRPGEYVKPVDHDPGWALEFARERDRILQVLEVPPVAIEHIGSTAIPGLRAKPTIDIMIGVADLDHARGWITPLAALGYRYLPEYEVVVPGRRLFRKGSHGKGTHCLHVYQPDDPNWAHVLRLRTYLLRHPEAVRAFAALKEELVHRHPADPFAYGEGKREFLETIQAAAASETRAESTPTAAAGMRRLARTARRRVRRGLARIVRVPRVGGWPRAFSSRDALEPRLAAASRTLERILVTAVLPFWRSRVFDHSNDGYHLNHGPTGRDLGPVPRHIIAQTRTLWFFARLAHTRWGEPSDLTAARQGFEFLVARLWDRRHGGFAWQVLADGEPLHPHKHALAQAYALVALAEYWQASQDPLPLALAREAFEVWDGVAHDGEHGGYVEMHRHDWSSAARLPGYWASDPSLKMLDSHLHITEGLAALYQVAPTPRLASRLTELLRILTTADADDPGGVTAFGRDWTPLPKQRVEYGFDVKRIALTMRLSSVMGEDPAAHRALYRRLFAGAMRWGWDRRAGGLFEAGVPHRRAHELVKSWWTQAELLTASLLMWRLTGEGRYAEVFLRALDWVEHHQVDWNDGDWHAFVDRRGQTFGRKAWAWKGPHHVPRAILDCHRILTASLYSAEP